MEQLQVVNFRGMHQCPPPSEEVQRFLETPSSPGTSDLSCCRTVAIEQPVGPSNRRPSLVESEDSEEEVADFEDTADPPSEEDLLATATLVEEMCSPEPLTQEMRDEQSCLREADISRLARFTISVVHSLSFLMRCPPNPSMLSKRRA
jgi:hypothetical protein